MKRFKAVGRAVSGGFMNKVSLSEKLRQTPSRWLYGTIAFLSLAFMFWQSGNFGFWYDEFAQICYSGLDMRLLDSFRIIDPTPPLFNVAANIWYDIAPYGDRWLMLLPQLATALGIYVSALWGERLGGKRAGIWTAVLMGSSYMLIDQCGFEFRGYGFFLLFASLTFYYHSRVLDRGTELPGKLGVRYGLCLLGLAYSHLFGCLIFLVIAAQDMLLVLRRRLPWRMILVYFLPGLCILPWGLRFFMAAGSSVVGAVSEWMVKPTLWQVVLLAAYFCSNHPLTCLMLAVGVLSLLPEVIRARKKREYETELIQKLVPVVTAAFTILAVFVYGKIRSENSSLWVKRYFTGLTPAFSVLCAYGMHRLCLRLEKRSARTALVANALCAALIVPLHLGIIMSGNLPSGRSYQREAVEVMYRQPDIHEESTVVLTTMAGYEEGLEEYYCQQKGRREGLGLRTIYRLTSGELLAHEVVYLEYSYGDEDSMSTQARQTLEEEYVVDEVWNEVYLRRYRKK